MRRARRTGRSSPFGPRNSDLTYNLLTRAIEDAKPWPEDLLLSINLSPRQFADLQLPQRILTILEMGGFAPRRLEVEITETAVLHNLDDAKSILQKLRDVGIKIALDDFGTGYAGLYHLRDLQLDSIKIDRSFIGQMLVKTEEGKDRRGHDQPRAHPWSANHRGRGRE